MKIKAFATFFLVQRSNGLFQKKTKQWGLRIWNFQGYQATLTKISSSGHPTDSPLKLVKKVQIWRSGGQHFRYSVCHFESSTVHVTWSITGKSMENPSTINNFFQRELNSKNSQFLMYTVSSANHFIGTINKFYKIRKITLQYSKNL